MSEPIRLVQPPLTPPPPEGPRAEQTQKPKEPKDKRPVWPVEPGAPLFVASAVVVCATLGGATGAVIGYRRRLNPFAVGVDMSIAWGLTSLAFFSVREYVVSPALIEGRMTRAHWQRADELGAGRWGSSTTPTQCVPWPHTHDAETDATVLVPSPPSVSDVRTARLADSGAAGMVVGAILSAPKMAAAPPANSIVRAILGRAAIGARAGFTGALVALFAQAAVNEGRVVRLKILASRAGAGASADAEADAASKSAPSGPAEVAQAPETPALCTRSPAPVVIPAASTAAHPTSPRTSPTSPDAVVIPSPAPAAPSAPPTTPPDMSISDSMAAPLKPTGEGRGDAPLSGKIMGVLARVLPVRRLSDDEYLATLERKRADVDKRLREIEAEQWAMFERAEAEREREGDKTG